MTKEDEVREWLITYRDNLMDCKINASQKQIEAYLFVCELTERLPNSIVDTNKTRRYRFNHTKDSFTITGELK